MLTENEQENIAAQWLADKNTISDLAKSVAEYHGITEEELYIRTVEGGEALYHQYYMRDGEGI
tara:strand:- start:43 stop:231 length:189 start_codon:yes stop_codon:yes gene_type:complete